MIGQQFYNFRGDIPDPEDIVDEENARPNDEEEDDQILFDDEFVKNMNVPESLDRMII